MLHTTFPRRTLILNTNICLRAVLMDKQNARRRGNLCRLNSNGTTLRNFWYLGNTCFPPPLLWRQLIQHKLNKTSTHGTWRTRRSPAGNTCTTNHCSNYRALDAKGTVTAALPSTVLLQDTRGEPKARNERSKLVFLHACLEIMTRTNVQHSSTAGQIWQTFF